MWPRCPCRSRAGRTAAGGRGPRAAPAPEQTPPHPAGAPTSQQAVKRVGHAKVKREAPVKTKVLEPARESRGSHGSLGATSGSTEPREGAGPCGWRRRPRPRRRAGPREASPSAWPPLALAVLPNPAHGSGTVPSRPGLTRLLPADDFVSLPFGCRHFAAVHPRVVRPLPSSLSSAGKGDRPPPPPQRLTLYDQLSRPFATPVCTFPKTELPRRSRSSGGRHTGFQCSLRETSSSSPTPSFQGPPFPLLCLRRGAPSLLPSGGVSGRMAPSTSATKPNSLP